jgi:diguanylate cyclase (GGDEF)-like protein
VGVAEPAVRERLSPELIPLIDGLNGTARRLLDVRSAEYRTQSQAYDEALVRSRMVELLLLVGAIAVATVLLGWIASGVRRTHLESRAALAREAENLSVARDQLDRMSAFDRSQARVLELIATDAALTAVLTATADAASARCGGLPVRIRWDRIEVCRPMGARIPGDAELAWSAPFGTAGMGDGPGEIAVFGRPDQLDADMRAGAVRCRDLARLGVDRDRAQHRLTFQATHDSLTGLTNRQVLLEELAEQLHLSSRTGCGLAVLFCNLDRFAVVNDSLGHDVGDLLLIETAARLRDVVRDADIVGRHGGDEFVVLSPTLMDVRDAVEHAERIRTALGETYRIDGHDLTLGVSIGVSYADDPALGTHDLMRAADLAMRRAKDQGGSRVSIFDDELEAHARTLLA